MNDVVIRAKDLSKQYTIYARRRQHDSLRDLLIYGVRDAFRRDSQSDTIWALKDASFEVRRGEVLGVIGRNGSGKSTLLKLLSRITEPTSGRAEIRGRVGSLLEIGTGFDRELTGRENVYFNGAILGMTKREIDQKFDDIVEFSGVEKFIDTPVKRYSSGMSVRLAFAVAAHLEPEILLVDEVLAVGDVLFQKKCLGKLRDVSQEGRTVLFVSHNMNAINAMCTKALWLDSGRVRLKGNRESVVAKYLESVVEVTDIGMAARTDRDGNGKLRFVDYHFENWSGEKLPICRSGQDVTIAVEYESDKSEKLSNVSVAFALSDPTGNRITDLANQVSGEEWASIPPRGVFRCHISRLPLMPGVYTFNVYASVNGVTADSIRSAGRLEVEVGDFFPTGRVLYPNKGFILMEHRWSADSQ